MLNESKEYLGEPIAIYQAAHKRRNEKWSLQSKGENNPLCMWNYYHILFYIHKKISKNMWFGALF